MLRKLWFNIRYWRVRRRLNRDVAKFVQGLNDWFAKNTTPLREDERRMAFCRGEAEPEDPEHWGDGEWLTWSERKEREKLAKAFEEVGREPDPSFDALCLTGDGTDE